jgi:hypothetical protein
MISLKLIVQQMLAASQPGGGEHQLSIPGELSGTSWAMPPQPQTRVLLHRGCHLSEELPALLQEAVPGLTVVLQDGELASHCNTTQDPPVRVVLLVVVHDRCFENDAVLRSLQFALEHKIRVALLHEADAEHGGCPFGSIMAQCPPDLQRMRGCDDAKLFGPIAVEYSRGPYQPVSIRLLAKSLGAVHAEKADGAWSAGACHRRALHAMLAMCKRPASTQTSHEITQAAAADGGWGVFGAATDEVFTAGHSTTNPLRAVGTVPAAPADSQKDRVV